MQLHDPDRPTIRHQARDPRLRFVDFRRPEQERVREGEALEEADACSTLDRVDKERSKIIKVGSFDRLNHHAAMLPPNFIAPGAAARRARGPSAAAFCTTFPLQRTGGPGSWLTKRWLGQ